MRITHAAWAMICIASLTNGCSKLDGIAEDGREGEATTSKETDGSEKSATAEKTSAVIRHDLGTLICHDQEVSHVFVIKNNTSGSLKVLDTKILTPCCSRIGKIPDSVGPGQYLEVPVYLRVGHRPGRKNVAFLIKTNQETHGLWKLELLSNLVEKKEIVLISKSKISVREQSADSSAGRVWTYRVISRNNQGDEAPPDLIKIVADPPLSAEIRNRNQKKAAGGATNEKTSEIAVELDGRFNKLGNHSGLLEVFFGDGTSLKEYLTWSNAPPIVVNPSGIILNGGETSGKREVMCYSANEPFSIKKIDHPDFIGVEGAALDTPAKMHKVKLSVRRTDQNSGKISNIIIHTSIKDQAEILISVYVVDKA